MGKLKKIKRSWEIEGQSKQLALEVSIWLENRILRSILKTEQKIYIKTPGCKKASFLLRNRKLGDGWNLEAHKSGRFKSSASWNQLPLFTHVRSLTCRKKPFFLQRAVRSFTSDIISILRTTLPSFLSSPCILAQLLYQPSSFPEQ